MRVHNSRRCLLMCKRCSNTFSSIYAAASHANRCGSKARKLGHQAFPCTSCITAFASKRGLTQHERACHPTTYYRKRAKMTATSQSRSTPIYDTTVATWTRTLLDPLPAVEETSGVLQAIEGALQRPTPSQKELDFECVNLIKKIRRLTGAKPVNHRKRMKSSPRRTNSKTAFATMQNLWRKGPKHAALAVLDGAPVACDIAPATIEAEYRSIWEANDTYVTLGQFGRLPMADNSLFHKPITAAEVLSSLKSMKTDKGPGPDGLKRSHLLMYDRKGVRLASMFNNWLLAGKIPSCLKRNRTVLIPKTNEPTKLSNPKGWRPITLGSLLLRMFSGILAAKLVLACPPHPRQKGFVQAPGCSENIMVLMGLMAKAKSKKTPLAVTFIDLAKAFDTVPHKLIMDSLLRRGVDQHIRKLFADSYSGCSSRIQLEAGMTRPVKLRIGVKQGDPLSPILFNLALDPFLYLLDEEGEGYNLEGGTSISALAYADDLVLMSDSWSGMKRNLDLLGAFSAMVGLRANPEKCHGFLISRRNNIPTLNQCPSWTINGEAIHMVSAHEDVAYLGVMINPWKGVKVPDITNQLESMTSKISMARLRNSQKIHVLQRYAIPRILYKADHCMLSVTRLKECDGVIRRAIKKWLHLDHFTPDGVIFSSPRDGGIGITKPSTDVPAIQLKRLIKMSTSDDDLTRQMGRLLALETQITKLWTTVTGSPPPKTLEFGEINTRRRKEREFLKWSTQAYHGTGIHYFHDDKVSNSWCGHVQKESILSETERIIAYQIRSMAFPVRARPGSRAPHIKCRLCQAAPESLIHIISNCPILKPNRMANHNKVVAEIERVAIDQGWTTLKEPHLKDRNGKTGVPDLLLFKEERIIIADVMICFEKSKTNLEDGAQAKVLKYKPFTAAALRLFPRATRVSVRGVAVGARGKWLHANNHLLKDLGLSKQMVISKAKYISRMALLGTITTCKMFKRLST